MAKWAHAFSQSIKDNSTSILSGAAIAGVIGTAVLASRATVKACETIADNEITSEPLTFKDKVRLTWVHYIPAGLSGIATITCIAWSNSIGIRRNVALMSAYTLVDTTFREYKDKVVEQIGENKERKVVDELHKELVQRNTPTSTQVLITGLGEQMCYDTLTGRYFKSDVETLRKAANTVGTTVLHDMYAPHNDFYRLIGLPSVQLGETMGWNIDNMLELVFSSHLSDCDVPCLAVGYARLPKVDYDKI